MLGEVSNTSLQRMFGYAVDNLFATILGFVAMAILKSENRVFGGVIVCLVYLLYFFAFEAIWARTPGKFLTRLEVRMSDGTAGTTRAAAIRTLARIIEANPLLLGGLPAAIAILCNKRRQRIGDMIADTVVVPKR